MPNKVKALAQDHQARLGLTLRPAGARAHAPHLPDPQHSPRPGFKSRLYNSPAVCLFVSFSTSLVLEFTSALCIPQAAILQVDGFYDKE